MRYRTYPKFINLYGPSGVSSFHTNSDPDISFVEFHRLPLANIRRFHLDTYGWGAVQSSPGPMAFHHLPSFPALEAFTIERETNLSLLLSSLLTNPSASPSLNTLAFFDCC